MSTLRLKGSSPREGIAAVTSQSGGANARMVRMRSYAQPVGTIRTRAASRCQGGGVPAPPSESEGLVGPQGLTRKWGKYNNDDANSYCDGPVVRAGAIARGEHLAQGLGSSDLCSFSLCGPTFSPFFFD